jgi:type I restriction enzyme S subunit
VRPEVVGKTEVALPPGAITAAYSELATLWLNRCGQLAEEANTLAALRDALLPRLMSGELRIHDAEAQVEEVL